MTSQTTGEVELLAELEALEKHYEIERQSRKQACAEVERLKARVVELELLVERHVRHADTYYSVCRMCGSNAEDLTAYAEWLVRGELTP